MRGDFQGRGARRVGGCRGGRGEVWGDFGRCVSMGGRGVRDRAREASASRHATGTLSLRTCLRRERIGRRLGVREECRPVREHRGVRGHTTGKRLQARDATGTLSLRTCLLGFCRNTEAPTHRRTACRRTVAPVNRPTGNQVGRRPATAAFSSLSSLMVASIFSLLKSLRGTSWTISHLPPSLRMGKEEIRPSSTP